MTTFIASDNSSKPGQSSGVSPVRAGVRLLAAGELSLSADCAGLIDLAGSVKLDGRDSVAWLIDRAGNLLRADCVAPGGKSLRRDNLTGGVQLWRGSLCKAGALSSVQRQAGRGLEFRRDWRAGGDDVQ